MLTYEQQCAELLRWYHRAPEDIKDEGRGWYSAQREVIRELSASYLVPLDTVAAVVAALSPMTRWTQNIAGAIRLLRAHASGDDVPPRNCTLFYKNAERAWRILTGETEAHDEFGTSPKVMAFWRNLSGDETGVTIDTWMLRACGEDRLATRGVKMGQYRAIADAIQDAAQIVGEVPAQFQAIVWVQIRRELSRFDTAAEAA